MLLYWDLGGKISIHPLLTPFTCPWCEALCSRSAVVCVSQWCVRMVQLIKPGCRV